MTQGRTGRCAPAIGSADYTFHQKVYALTKNSFLIQACQAIAAARATRSRIEQWLNHSLSALSAAPAAAVETK